MKDDIQIVNCGSYFTLVNKSRYADYDNHTHIDINRYDIACMLKRLIEKGEVPRNEYLQESAYRVSVNREYLEKLRHYL